MGWVYFCILSWATTLLLVPGKSWRMYWPIGVFGLITLYLIDNMLSSLDAFRFYHPLIRVGALPLGYWLGSFPGGILFAYFRPKKDSLNILHILASALLLLFAELIMIYAGYFQHVQWNIAKSFMLNIFGFTIIFWLTEFWESNIISHSRHKG